MPELVPCYCGCGELVKVSPYRLKTTKRIFYKDHYRIWMKTPEGRADASKNLMGEYVVKLRSE